ncbi:hypothetical protein TYRP_000980 [Tyrophagus putrescentiae]|nr:hypothetical protein TYRP_000980 [Tyrophagus putrescentiae]
MVSGRRYCVRKLSIVSALLYSTEVIDRQRTICLISRSTSVTSLKMAKGVARAKETSQMTARITVSGTTLVMRFPSGCTTTQYRSMLDHEVAKKRDEEDDGVGEGDQQHADVLLAAVGRLVQPHQLLQLVVGEVGGGCGQWHYQRLLEDVEAGGQHVSEVLRDGLRAELLLGGAAQVQVGGTFYKWFSG